ncbi:MAG TPA: zinc-binding dehydrogenase [Acidimicrobiia bacterium]|nr:zinc-binding dehydrogenase [Acidimicrobiia bacterium]
MVRAVRSDGNGGVAVVDVDLVEPDYASDPVHVRVTSASICGSDLKLLSWNLPATMGHEFAGVLDDGTPVAVQPSVPCGECDQCLAGNDNLCRASGERVLGIFSDGGLADAVVVDRKDLAVLPQGVGTDVGALAEPVAVAVRAAHRAGLHGDAPPGRVLVIGAGSIGLALVTVARHHGADVDLVARHPAQRDAGERLGASLAVGDEYDVVLDCAGSQSSLDTAIGHVRPGGTIVVPGTWFDPVQMGTSFLMKEARLLPSYTYGHHRGVREFDEAVEVLAAHPELADTIVTHRFPLDDAPEAFRVAADRAHGAIKVVIEP